MAFSEFPVHRFTRVDVLESCESTNTELAARAAAGWPHFSAVLTGEQTSGRGRLGRQWSAPAGESVAISVLLRPSFGAHIFGWIPLITGVAMACAVAELLSDAPAPVTGEPKPAEPVTAEPTAPADLTPRTPGTVGVKWPNDVQVDGLKVSGVLSELQPDGSIVVGVGLNLSIPADRLPTPTSTSLTISGAEPYRLAERAVDAFAREFRIRYDQLAGGTVPEALRDEIRSQCTTLGKRVRVELPDGTVRFGTARDLDVDGRLIVHPDENELAGGGKETDAQLLVVAAGDVTHVRYE